MDNKGAEYTRFGSSNSRDEKSGNQSDSTTDDSVAAVTKLAALTVNTEVIADWNTGHIGSSNNYIRRIKSVCLLSKVQVIPADFASFSS